MTPVFSSNKNQSMDMPTYTLSLDGVEVHYNEAEAKTALFDAAKNDTPGIIEDLYYAGLDLDITDDDDGKTALALAVENNSMNVLCDLIDLEADFELDETDRKAVLFYAVENDNFHLVERLLRKGILNNMTGDDVIEFLDFWFDDYREDDVYESIVECNLHGRTVLFLAAENDMSYEIFRLHRAGLDLDITDDDGKTAVFYADENKSMDALCALIDLGAEFKLDEIDGKAVLFHAAKNDMHKVVSQLSEAGLDLNVTDDDGKTALALAIESNSMNVVCKLIRGNAHFVLDDIDGKAVLFHAAKNNDEIQLEEKCGRLEKVYGLEGVVKPLRDAGLDLNETDKGKTAVFYANNQFDKHVLCELIECGADFDLDEIDGKKALLFCAVECGMDKTVSKLLSGLDVNITDNLITDYEGKTALFYAVQKSNNQSVVRILIDAGIDVKRFDNEGKTALFHAVQQSNNESVLRALIDAGADVNTIDKVGKTALFYAVQQSNNKSVVRALIDAGADIKITDNEGKTALFYAVDRDAVDALIKKDEFFINRRDQYDRTALFYALKHDSMTTARYLIDKGGNLYLKDKCGVNIFTFFIEKSSYRALSSDVSKLFQEPHQLNSLAAAVLDVIFCQAPLLSAKSGFLSRYEYRYRILDETYLLEALTFARTQGFTQDEDKRKVFDKIAFLITEDKVDVPSLLAWLTTLGANPDAADSDGNTALHYATLLPLYDVSQQTVIEICNKLKDLGAMFDVKNQQQQSPLLFCLSVNNLKAVESNNPWHRVRGLVKVCRLLLNNGSSVNETSQSGESAFHLLIKLVHKLFNLQEGSKQPDVLQELIELLRLVSSKALERGKEIIANKNDGHLNSPLHLWASLTLPSSTDYSSRLTEDHTFENILQLIFDIFLKCGAKLNARNENDDTPLHLCKTWAAVKLLIKAGANPNELNSSKRSPLLVAAKEKTYLEKPGCFYPDVADDPQTFWRGALEGGLDPWTADKQGESVLSILIESEAFVLAKPLIDVGIELNHIQCETKLALLCIICKDKSTHTHWKTNLVEIILKSAIKSRLPVDSALRLCCRNIVHYSMLDDEAAKNQKYVQQEAKGETNNDDGQPPNKKRRKEEEKEELNDDLVTFDSVHWKLAKQLLWYGVDIKIHGPSGESCLDIAENCPALKDLLTKPIDIDSVPLLIPWTSVSSRYKRVMAKVARRQECEIVEQNWYHRDHIGSGSFGLIFAGINEKDGREVAIKRIEKLRLHRPQDKREIQNLTALADCQQVVRYVSFFEDQHFCYVVLELMEGNLEEYLNESTIDATETTRLCKDVVMGLTFLHEQNILHRDLKPQNILYKKHPKLCLKIADFGLSRRIDSTSTTVYGTNAGTRCWIAPEILMSPPKDHSKSSDMFSCGLLLYYILSGRKHPFSPADYCANKFQVSNETEANLMKGKVVGWDKSLSPEASHLVRKMIERTVKNRPTAVEAIDHPLFWPKVKKIDFLIAVGNQPEFECPRANRRSMGPLTIVEKDLENSFGAIVKYRSWADLKYFHVNSVFSEMTRRNYNTYSAVELVRFIRNAYVHVSSLEVPAKMLEDFVFLEYFPALVMEVYKAVTVTPHGWDQERDEIKCAMNK